MNRIGLNVLLVSTVLASAANAQVANGNFSGDLSSWIGIGATVGNNGVGGSKAAQLKGFSFISQAIDTIVGTTYTVSFTLANSANAAGNLQVFFGGQTLYSSANQLSFGLFQFSNSFTATTGSTTFLALGNRSDSGTYVIDDVKLTVPAVGSGIVQVPGPEIGASAVPVLGFAAYIAWRRRQKQTS